MDWDSQESQSLTWQYTADSVLRYNVRFLHVCGLWPLYGSRLFRVFIVATLILCFAHIAEAGINLCTLRGDLEDYTLALSNVTAVIVGVLKAAIFLRKEDGLCLLVRWLDVLVERQRDDLGDQPSLQATFTEARKRAGRISKGLDTYNLSLLVLWILVPVMAPSEDRRLPFQQVPMANTTTFPLYELSYAVQSISVILICLISVHLDCFFIAVMILIGAQLQIVATRIDDLHLRNVAEKKDLTIGDTYKELRLCIQTHQNITRFIEHLERVMNPIAMLQLAFGVFTGCMLIFPAAYSSERGSLVKVVVTMPAVSVQLLLYCLEAHRVREQGELVSLAAYSCGWPDCDVSLQRTLLLVMTRAQKPLRLTAGGVYPIQRATFLSLLNAGYSYYAVLQNFNGR